MTLDAGSRVDILSLAGIPGRRLETEFSSRSGTATFPVLFSNPARLWALLTNDGASDVWIQFRGMDEATTQTHTLSPRGSILIDRNMPWTGPVTACGNGVDTATVCVTECSVRLY